MESSRAALPKHPVSLPDIPALCVNTKNAAILTSDGEVKTLSHDAARMLVNKKPVMVCHAPFTRTRLGLDEFLGFDVLELYAFVHPVQFCVPTPIGLCNALGLNPPQDFEDQPFALMDIASALLSDIQKDPFKAKADPIKIARLMGLQGKGWAWTPFIFQALGENYDPAEQIFGKNALNIWRNLPEWSEEAPPPPASHEGVSKDEAIERLQALLGSNSETREQQKEYTAYIARTFAPVQAEEDPHIVLAEAGTGVGKTLGYLSPASVWAEKNKGSVWISTYTKNLQRQIDGELSRLYPDADLKDIHVAIRKGRENYLCLLNFEDLAGGAALARHPDHAISAGLMARWIAASKDGDLSGADFPGWLVSLLGYKHTGALADRRGECIYSACDHYHRCFVEKSVRKARHARLVVANHALVMINAAISQPGDDMPTRYIFDEGHHLFHAADSAFAAHLTARETRDLRRWILGAEGGRQSRARGLKKRLEDLVSGDGKGEDILQSIIKEAYCLTSEGWSKRLSDEAPSGPTEEFLLLLYKQVMARADGRDTPYSLETDVHPVNDGVLQKAQKLRGALRNLQKPMQGMVQHLRKKLADDNGEMDSDTRKRLDAVAQSLERRSAITLSAWIGMLEHMEVFNTPSHPVGMSNENSHDRELENRRSKASHITGSTPSNSSSKSAGMTNEHNFIDWLEIERIDGRAFDTGYYRHWVDPMKPFSLSMNSHLHGMAITSATLRDSTGNDEEDWKSAAQQTGMDYFGGHIHQIALQSPFNYAQNTRVYIINDVSKNDINQLANAYRVLFEASQGGALGLFTAIARLRAVHERIAPKLEDKGMPLYSQHVDEIDAGSLVDMFREDIHACLLGTDAVRDGVDVPGESLRLLIFDRVPWPRPTILHKARREAFGGRAYDEMITRMKLKQAYGRLIRRADDRGIFVMMDNMFPSRLHNAFPEGVEVIKCGLAEARHGIAEFLK